MRPLAAEVTPESVHAHDFPGAGHLEPLRSGFVGLQLRHGLESSLVQPGGPRPKTGKYQDTNNHRPSEEGKWQARNSRDYTRRSIWSQTSGGPNLSQATLTFAGGYPILRLVVGASGVRTTFWAISSTGRAG